MSVLAIFKITLILYTSFNHWVILFDFKHLSRLPTRYLTSYHSSLITQALITLVSGNAGDEKNLHHSRPQIYFFNRFSGYILFSSLVSFAFFCILFFFFACMFVFWNWKLYILIHIRPYGRVSDKNFSPGRFLETRILFFCLKTTLLKETVT